VQLILSKYLSYAQPIKSISLKMTALVASLKRRGVSDAVIEEALSEVVHAQSY
jgi:hypothetical protein